VTSGFTVYFIALDTQSQMLATQQIIADSEVAKIQEKFIVAASSSGVNNLLSLQVLNIGNNAVEIADVWIINKTGTEIATRYDLDYRDVSIPVGHNGNILSNTPLYLISDVYNIKVISSIGTIQAVEYDVAGGSNILSAQMVAIPQDVRFGENVTVALIVTNTGDFSVKDVLANTLDVNPNQCTATPNPIFLGPADLSPAQSTMFFWDCVLDPPTGNIITFTANATGKLSGVDVDSNNAYDSVIIRDFSAGNFGDELILKDELFGRPELFMLLPNAFGSLTSGDTGQGYWGVTVANPTNKTMTVSKVSISALRGNANDNVVLIPTVGCTLTEISPTDGNWGCTNNNVLTWKSATNPIIIQRQSAYQFIVALEPGQTTDSLESVVISSSVFTSLGAFGKGPYDTSVQKKTIGEVIANVYLQDATGGGNIQGVIGNLTSQQIVLFNATIADFSQNPPGIDEISELIVNIPKEWEFNGPVTLSSGFDIITSTVFADDSTQIVGGLSADLDNGEAWFQFSATAPGNTSGNAKMYVFHILGSGLSTNAGDPYLIGPVAETVVQVCPTSGGPAGCP